MDVLKELTQLLESQKRVAIGKSRGPAKIGQSVNVEISSSLLGKRGVVRAIALTPISSSGIEVGLAIDDRKRIVAVAKAQEELSRDVIINDRWEAEEKPKPKPSSKSDLGGVVLFAALKEVPKPNAVPDCTCPTLNYAQPRVGDKQFQSCKEELQISQNNLGPIAQFGGAAATFFYASHSEGSFKDSTPGLPYGWAGNYGAELYWLPSVEDTGGFYFESGAHRGISYYKANNKIEGGDLIIYSYFHQERVIVVGGGSLPEETMQLLFGGDYARHFLETSSLSDEEKAALTVDLTPVITSIGESPSDYIVRDYTSDNLKFNPNPFSIRVAEYREYWWQIFENHWDISSPLIKTFRVAVTELRKTPPEIMSGPSFDRLRLGLGQFDFKIRRAGSVNLGPVPKPSGGGSESQDPQQFFDEDGATLGSNNYYNTEFYLGGFTQEPYKLPYTLRGDDPHKATIDRIAPNRYQIVIISGTHQMAQTKENGDYLIKHAPWMVGDTWDYLINKAPNDPDSIGSEVRKSSNFRACEAQVFVINIIKEVVTIEKNEHFNYPDEIPNYGESFKDRWYDFVLGKHKNYSNFMEYGGIETSFNSNSYRKRGHHRFTLKNYQGSISMTQDLDYKSNDPILNAPYYEENFYTYSPNTIKEFIGYKVGSALLEGLFPSNIYRTTGLEKFLPVRDLFLGSYLDWLKSYKPTGEFGNSIGKIYKGFSKINPLYWLKEDDYKIRPRNFDFPIDTDPSFIFSYPGTYYLGGNSQATLFQPNVTELVSACRTLVTDFYYPITAFYPNHHLGFDKMPTTTERSNWLIENTPITYGVTLNITDKWANSHGSSRSDSASLSSTTIFGFEFTTQNVGIEGNLEIPTGFCTQLALRYAYGSHPSFKAADIEIYKNRTRFFNFQLECELADQDQIDLGTALYVTETTSDKKNKIKAPIVDLKHEFIENYGESTYTHFNNVSKVNSNGTITNVSNGEYELKKETFDIVSLNKVSVEIVFNGQSTTINMPDYTLKTISLYPLRQPEFYAICLFGMQTYDDRIKSANTPEEEE